MLDSAVGTLDTLSDIALALANDINANAATDFTATAASNQLVVVNRAGGAFTTAFALTLISGELGGAVTVDATTAKTTSVALGGTPVTNDTWTLTLVSTPFQVVVGNNYTINGVSTTVTSLPQIAAAFAQAINDSSATADFTAKSSGSVLVIVNRVGTAFTTNLAVTTATAPATSSAATSAIVTLGGAPVMNDTWTLTLTPSGGAASPVSYQVGLTGTLVKLIGTAQLGDV